MSSTNPAPITTLDQLIANAIQHAREQAISETTKRIISSIGESHEVQGIVYAEVKRLIEHDPEIKAKLRESVLKMLDAAPRRY